MQPQSSNSEIDKYVIEKVKSIRLSKGISQAKLAIIIDLSVGFVGNIENPNHIAKWNINLLNRISKELNVPFKDFFPESGI